MGEAPLLEVSNIETSYSLSQVLFGLSFAIAPGEMVTLMGRNGMGKTTTVRSIMGLTPASGGAIRFGGRDVRGLAPLRGKGNPLPAVLPCRATRHRARSGGAADLSQSQRT